MKDIYATIVYDLQDFADMEVNDDVIGNNAKCGRTIPIPPNIHPTMVPTPLQVLAASQPLGIDPTPLSYSERGRAYEIEPRVAMTAVFRPSSKTIRIEPSRNSRS
jgi:hypothetical protein